MNKRDINQIVRKLKCSNKRREEIKKQLLSEMDENSSEGMVNVGNPEEIAEEFNSSFSEKEKMAYKRGKRLKIAGIIVLVLLIIGGIVWWMLPKQIWIEDSEIFDKVTVMEQAELVVKYLDNDDYDALQEISDETMKVLFETGNLREEKALMGESWGEQESVGNVYMVELTQKGRKSAVVQMHVQYENVNVMYTICFNRDMELEGLWLQ